MKTPICLLTLLCAVFCATAARAQIKMASINEAAWYSIIATHSGKALEIADVPGASLDGRQLQQDEVTGADNQLFQFKQIQSGYFQITAKSSGRVLEIRDNSMKDHAVVQQNQATGAENQLFTLCRDADGNYSIIVKSSGYGFDVLGGVNALGDKIAVIVYPAGGARNQRFKLVQSVPPK